MDRALALFQQNVRRLLGALKMSERSLAKKIEMAPAQFNTYMHETIPSLSVLTRVAAALGVTPAALLLTEEERRDREIAGAILARATAAVPPPDEALAEKAMEFVRQLARVKTPAQLARILEEAEKAGVIERIRENFGSARKG